MLKVDLNFKKLLDTIKHPELALDHSKAYLFLVGTLTGIEDLFLTCSKVDENSYQAKCVQLHWQGYWTKWCDFVKNDLSCKTLLAMPSSLISFCLGATFDTLPSPSNLKRWRLITDSSCFLCQKGICTSTHFLEAHKIALHQGLLIFLDMIKSFCENY